MKTLMSLALVAVAAALSSCTSTTTTTAQSDSTKPIYTTEKKVYTKAELDKRGRQNVGEALAAQDASVTYSGR